MNTGPVGLGFRHHNLLSRAFEFQERSTPQIVQARVVALWQNLVLHSLPCYSRPSGVEQNFRVLQHGDGALAWTKQGGNQRTSTGCEAKQERPWHLDTRNLRSCFLRTGI